MEESLMSDYIFSADLLNKYSQLTPWVQALIILAITAIIIFTTYFIKETISLFCKPKPSQEKDEWRDSYYRDDEKH